jgi:hypothetical protein
MCTGCQLQCVIRIMHVAYISAVPLQPGCCMSQVPPPSPLPGVQLHYRGGQNGSLDVEFPRHTGFALAVSPLVCTLTQHCGGVLFSDI